MHWTLRYFWSVTNVCRVLEGGGGGGSGEKSLDCMYKNVLRYHWLLIWVHFCSCAFADTATFDNASGHDQLPGPRLLTPRRLRAKRWMWDPMTWLNWCWPTVWDLKDHCLLFICCLQCTLDAFKLYTQVVVQEFFVELFWTFNTAIVSRIDFQGFRTAQMIANSTEQRSF